MCRGPRGGRGLRRKWLWLLGLRPGRGFPALVDPRFPWPVESRSPAGCSPAGGWWLAAPGPCWWLARPGGPWLAGWLLGPRLARRRPALVAGLPGSPWWPLPGRWPWWPAGGLLGPPRPPWWPALAGGLPGLPGGP